MNDYLEISLRLLTALVFGGLVGFERSYHGRPAGFRTHTLVCLASALLMLVTVYEAQWFVPQGSSRVSIDPTRMAQGIMTGIGFLGAGVILKEGLTVRGLTTAASIWITAAIGILAGVGFYFPALVGTALTLGTLSIFRRIELIMPALYYARLEIRFRRHEAMHEEPLRALITEHGFSVANLSYALKEDGKMFEYAMIIRTSRRDDTRRLAGTLAANDKVLEFLITPAGD